MSHESSVMPIAPALALAALLGLTGDTMQGTQRPAL